jgi:Fe-S cluster biosynthesis and repair protein YggX
MNSATPRMVDCVVLKQRAPGLERLPYPGELGTRIWKSVSKEGWQRWVAHQTMLINENRLTPIEPKARKFLEGEMEKFFFGGGPSKVEGYVEPKAK